MRTNPVLTPSKVRYISHLGHTLNIAEPRFGRNAKARWMIHHILSAAPYPCGKQKNLRI